MNRKDFISAVIPLSTFSDVVFENKKIYSDPSPDKKIPAYLKKGDTIGICCPSGYISLEDIQPAVSKMKEWGFEIKIGNSVGAKDFTFAGKDNERAKDLQSMLDDPTIKAIMFGRGGYGAIRIIDKIDFKNFSVQPKWIIGFSDVTVFHCDIHKNFGIATLHSKMCNSFPDDWSNAELSQIESINSIQKCLTGEKIYYDFSSNINNRLGAAEGILIGGNLSILQNLAGTNSDINTNDKILFIEEVEEYLYSIDRMLWNLKRTGKLDHLSALIVGGFNRIKPDDPGEEFGKTLYEMVMEKVAEFNYPVCFDFPVGHQKYNVALKCGVKHRLVLNKNANTLFDM